MGRGGMLGVFLLPRRGLCHKGCKVDVDDGRVSSGVTWTLGTAKGRIRLLTTGGTRLGSGRTGVDAHSAAVVSCVTKEKELLGDDEVRNAFFSRLLMPDWWACASAVTAGGCKRPWMKEQVVIFWFMFISRWIIYCRLLLS